MASFIHSAGMYAAGNPLSYLRAGRQEREMQVLPNLIWVGTVFSA